MKKLMILGAGVTQKKLGISAKKLGYYVIMCSIPGNYPGFEVADEIAYADITDPDAVLKEAKRLKIDGVTTCCMDIGVPSVGVVCDSLNLKGPSAESAARCNNKLFMKKALVDYGVKTARYKEIDSGEQLKEEISDFNYPIVIKAVDLAGSKGVYICRNEEEVFEKYEIINDLSRQGSCIIEEYISGEEFGAQAFVCDGEVLFVLPHGDVTYISGTAVPIGHYVPLEIENTQNEVIKNTVVNAIKAVGLDNCAVNVDLIRHNDEYYILELTGRAGATCLPETVSIFYGVDYYEMIAALAVGDDVKEIFDNGLHQEVASLSRMLLSEKDGILAKTPQLTIESNNLYDFKMFKERGDKIKKFKSAEDRIGHVVVKGNSYKECKSAMEEILANLVIEME